MIKLLILILRRKFQGPSAPPTFANYNGPAATPTTGMFFLRAALPLSPSTAPSPSSFVAPPPPSIHARCARAQVTIPHSTQCSHFTFQNDFIFYISPNNNGVYYIHYTKRDVSQIYVHKQMTVIADSRSVICTYTYIYRVYIYK